MKGYKVKVMGTRRTNILLEFSDEVYDTLVEPLKKNKSFTKLVSTLIDGYLNDGYIRAFADDTLDGIRNKAVSSFNDSIDSMNETLSEMGLFTDELEATAMGGRDMFKKKATEQANELERNRLNTDISAVNARMDAMQGSIEDIMSLLKEVIGSGGINSIKNGGDRYTQKVIPVDKNDVIKPLEKAVEQSVVTEKPIEKPAEKPIMVVAPTENDVVEEEGIANDFMASMLVGNAYEF